MAQFKYANEINSLLNIDGPITKGPIPRWQRKGLENSMSSGNNSVRSLSTSINTSTTSKTPTKRIGCDVVKPKKDFKTPSKSKSPGRSGTPTPSKPKTPSGGDRFIPLRSASNLELAQYIVNKAETDNKSPINPDMERALTENIQPEMNNKRVLAFERKVPPPPLGFQNPTRILYTQTKTPASIKSTNRYIPQVPDRILDAPDIVDDYYLNLIDWSANNVLAAALGEHVYLWNAGTGTIDHLLELQRNDYVCSVSWTQEGEYLAVGTTQGTVELWDCARSKRLRIMEGHSARVGSLSWNSHILSSGSRSGQINHHDVRQREHLISTLSGHTQEVCGLKWSPDGKYLASGGNDNVLNIWQSVSGAYHSDSNPLYTLTAHQAAVKALAWCPWQPHVLASGGGTADRHIRFWNCHSGACMNSIDTKSQVCSLLFSSNYKELISGHGFANNQLIIWKYPGMTKVAELTGHSARVLHLAMSPDGSTVLSAGADETLRLWKCFEKTVTKSKDAAQGKSKPSILKSISIR